MKLMQFQKYLVEQDIDLVFLAHPDISITYFTQLQFSKALLVIRSRKVVLFTSKLDQKPHLSKIDVKEIPLKWEERFTNFQVKKVGINQDVLTLCQYRKLEKIFPRAQLIDVSEKLKELRIQKTGKEVALLKKAAQITDFAFNSLLKQLKHKELNTELDVSFFLERTMRLKGAELSFPPIVATASNSAVPHHLTSTQKLKKGFLLLDFGAKYRNYCADMTRMLYLGQPSAEERKMYSLLLQAQKTALKGIKSGQQFMVLNRLVKEVLGQKASFFTHKLGHGVGVEIHEQPTLSDSSEQVVTKNHIFTVEPGIYFPGKYGLRIEDTILFDGKVKVLTQSSKDLIEIPF